MRNHSLSFLFMSVGFSFGILLTHGGLLESGADAGLESKAGVARSRGGISSAGLLHHTKNANLTASSLPQFLRSFTRGRSEPALSNGRWVGLKGNADPHATSVQCVEWGSNDIFS
jgi:hypothetical protein